MWHCWSVSCGSWAGLSVQQTPGLGCISIKTHVEVNSPQSAQRHAFGTYTSCGSRLLERVGTSVGHQSQRIATNLIDHRLVKGISMGPDVIELDFPSSPQRRSSREGGHRVIGPHGVGRAFVLEAGR